MYFDFLTVSRNPPTRKSKYMCFLRYAGDGATTKRRFRRWNIVIVSLLAFLVLGAFVANHPSYLVPQRTAITRSEEHTSELQSRLHLVCRLLLEKKKKHHVAQSVAVSLHTCLNVLHRQSIGR